MIKRSQYVRLRDILDNIDAVREMTAGVDLAGYQGELKLRRAVERCVEIVSEATRHIPLELKSAHPEVPWEEIASIGNLLRHHYERIDSLIMWKIATRSLPDLRAVILAHDQTGRAIEPSPDTNEEGPTCTNSPCRRTLSSACSRSAGGCMRSTGSIRARRRWS